MWEIIFKPSLLPLFNIQLQMLRTFVPKCPVNTMENVSNPFLKKKTQKTFQNGHYSDFSPKSRPASVCKFHFGGVCTSTFKDWSEIPCVLK